MTGGRRVERVSDPSVLSRRAGPSREPSSSGFGFRSAARYVVRGRVFSSASSAVVALLGLAASRRGCSGSFRSPKTIASDGHAAWQAGHDLAVADRAILALRVDRAPG